MHMIQPSDIGMAAFNTAKNQRWRNISLDISVGAAQDTFFFSRKFSTTAYPALSFSEKKAAQMASMILTDILKHTERLLGGLKSAQTHAEDDNSRRLPYQQLFNIYLDTCREREAN